MHRGSTRLGCKLHGRRHGNARQQQADGAGHALRVGAHYLALFANRRPSGRHDAAIAVDRTALGRLDGKRLFRTVVTVDVDVDPRLVKRVALPTVLQLLLQQAVRIRFNLERHLFAGLHQRLVRGHRGRFKRACTRRFERCGRRLRTEAGLRRSVQRHRIVCPGHQPIELACALRFVIGDGNDLGVLGSDKFIRMRVDLLPRHYEATHYAFRCPGNLARSRARRLRLHFLRLSGNHGQVGRRAGSVRRLAVFAARCHATERRTHVVRAHALHRERRHAVFLVDDVLVAIRNRGEVLLACALALPSVRDRAPVACARLRRERCILASFHPCRLGHLREYGHLDSGLCQRRRVRCGRELAGHAVRERSNAHLVGRARLKVHHLVAQLAAGVRLQAARSHRVRGRTHRIAVGIQLRALDLVPIHVINWRPRNRETRGRGRVACDVRRRRRRDGHRHDVRAACDRLVRRGRLHTQLPLPPVVFGGHRMLQGCRVFLAAIIFGTVKRNRIAFGLPIRVALAPGVPLQLGSRWEPPALWLVGGRKLNLVAQVGDSLVGRDRPGAHLGTGHRRALDCRRGERVGRYA